MNLRKEYVLTKEGLQFNKLEENAIITLAQKGNDEAMEHILSEYRWLAKAKSRSYFLMGGEKEDIIQEGMIGLYKAVNDFDPTMDTRFQTFAELCITRQILTAIKTATRLKHQPLNSYVSFNKPIGPEEGQRTLSDILYLYSNRTPEELLISKETTRLLMAKIKDSLSNLENRVLDLYLKGEDYHKISGTLDKPLKSIDNALQRIRRKISVIVQEMAL